MEQKSSQSDPRGEIKVYTKPPKKVDQEVLNQQVQSNPQPKERVVVEYRDRKRSFFGAGFFLRLIGCWIPVLFVVALIVIIITKPAGAWNILVDFVNSDINVPQNQAMTLDNAREQINSQITAVGQNTIHINESQLTALASRSLPQLSNLQTDIEEDGIRFYWEIDKTIPENPLYGIIKIGKNAAGEIAISQIGTQRISFPEFLNQVISDSLISVIDISNQTDKTYRLVYNLLSPDQNLKIDNLEFQNDQIELLVTVEARLF